MLTIYVYPAVAARKRAGKFSATHGEKHVDNQVILRLLVNVYTTPRFCASNGRCDGRTDLAFPVLVCLPRRSSSCRWSFSSMSRARCKSSDYISYKTAHVCAMRPTRDDPELSGFGSDPRRSELVVSAAMTQTVRTAHSQNKEAYSRDECRHFTAYSWRENPLLSCGVHTQITDVAK